MGYAAYMKPLEIALLEDEIWLLYLRISDDKNNDELGVARQKKRGLRECAGLGDSDPQIFQDNDISGSKGLYREHYENMLAAMRTGYFNGRRIAGVWVFGADRLVRVMMEFEEFVLIAQRQNILLGTRSGIKNLRNATDLKHARAEVADGAYEVHNMKERMAEKFEEIAEAGLAWWPCRPFGYTMPEPATRKKARVAPQVVEEEAELIRRAYEAVSRGRALKEIAREWNAMGVRTPKRDVTMKEGSKRRMTGENEWTSVGLRNLLLNPRNAGLRERTTRDWSGNKTREILVGVETEWDAIVDEAKWREVFALLKSRTRTPNSWMRKYLCSGLAVCGKDACGTPLSAHKPAPTRGAVYICRQCFGVSRKIADVDAWVAEIICDRLSAPDAHRLREWDEIDPDRRAAAEKTIRKCEGERKYYRQQKRDDLISEEELNEELAILAEKITAAKADLQDPKRVETFDDVLPTDEDPDRDPWKAFPALPLDRRRVILNELFTIAVFPGQKHHQPFDKSLVRPIEWKR